MELNKNFGVLEVLNKLFIPFWDGEAYLPLLGINFSFLTIADLNALILKYFGDLLSAVIALEGEILKKMILKPDIF